MKREGFLRTGNGVLAAVWTRRFFQKHAAPRALSIRFASDFQRSTTAGSSRHDSSDMKLLLLLPLIAGGFLFTGCEVTEVDRRPVAYHRYDRGYNDSYYRGQSQYYDRDPNYRTRPVYREGYYARSRPGYSSYDYDRTRAPYRSGVSLRVDSTVHRNDFSDSRRERTSVTRRGPSLGYYQAAASKQKRYDKDDKKRGKKGRD